EGANYERFQILYAFSTLYRKSGGLKGHLPCLSRPRSPKTGGIPGFSIGGGLMIHKFLLAIGSFILTAGFATSTFSSETPFTSLRHILTPIGVVSGKWLGTIAV